MARAKDVDGKRQCNTCEQWFPSTAEHFHRLKNRLQGKCKDCANEYCKGWRRANIERDAYNKRRVKYAKYGLTPESYDAMVSKQGGVCAICMEPEQRVNNGTLQELTIDHCHKTGEVRGLLCRKCNVALGGFGDSEEGLLAAIAYLRKHRLKAVSA